MEGPAEIVTVDRFPQGPSWARWHTSTTSVQGPLMFMGEAPGESPDTQV